MNCFDANMLIYQERGQITSNVAKNGRFSDVSNAKWLEREACHLSLQVLYIFDIFLYELANLDM